MKIEILVYNSRNSLLARGVETVDAIEEYEVLKDLMIEAVTGKLSFLKLRDEDGTDSFLGVAVLKKSKIIVKPIDEKN